MKTKVLAITLLLSFFANGQISTSDFVTTWKTDNPGTLSNDSSIYISADTTNFIYNYDVDWNNDGVFDAFGVTGPILHQYSAPGTYTIRIRGEFQGVFFGAWALPGSIRDRNKLISIDQWGTIAFKELFYAFWNCSYLNVLATDAPVLDSISASGLIGMFRGCTSLNSNLNHWDVSAVTRMDYMFSNASAFNQPLNNWDVSNVIEMQNIFYHATNFNQNLGDWDLSSVTNTGNMLDQTGLSIQNYDSTLIGWYNQNLPAPIGAPWSGTGAQGLKYCNGKIARDSLNAWGWNFLGDSVDCSPNPLNDFVTTWKTDNPGGLSNDSSITINTINFWSIPATYNYDVDWNNDGIFDTLGVTGNITHQYASSGTYTIRIRGDFPGLINMGNAPACTICPSNDSKKLISIDQWGSQQWEIMQGAYSFNTNLNITAIDAPLLDSLKGQHLALMFHGASSLNANINHWDVSNVTDMSVMFKEATSFNSPLDNWDVSSVDEMSSMFSYATSFNQSLGHWNLSNSPNMAWMLEYSGLSTENYDSTLIGWFNQNPPDSLVPFFTTGLTYCHGKNARDSLIAHGWVIAGDVYDCSAYNDFVTTWKTDNPGTLSNDSSIYITASAAGYTFNYDVDWNNDGVFDTIGVTGDISHQYAVPGTYTIRIRGDFPNVFFGGALVTTDPLDKDKLLSVDQWGNTGFEFLNGAFAYCSNMNVLATDAPILDSVTTLNGLFMGCNSLNASLDHWDVSSITEMIDMFNQASSFNHPLNNWDVSSVTDMSGMFNNASSFNQPLDNWDVQYVGPMIAMFLNASSFNQNLGSWKIWGVTGMQLMLSYSGLSVANYDSTLIGWYANSLPNNMVPLSSHALKYCNGKAARDSLIAIGWTIYGDTLDCSSPLNDFVTTWKTDNSGTLSNDSSIYITASGSTPNNFNYDVDWNNDGVFDTLGVTGDISHQYASPGTYTIRIRGDFPNVFFGGALVTTDPLDKDKLLSVDQWGNTGFKFLNGAFANCSNMDVLATDAPILNNLTSFSLIGMFDGCTTLNADINHWDVSSITDMSLMFDSAIVFNQSLSNWDVSNVTNMGGMFKNAKAFNQNLGGWDISSVQATAVPLINGMWTMLDSTNLSVANYDSTLIGWNSQPHNPNIGLGSAGLMYCLSKDARDSLMADGWIFYGDSFDPNCSAMSVLENQIEQQIHVYPNPSSGSFTIDFENQAFEGNLEIYSLSGQRVYQQVVNVQPKLELNLELAKGVYLLKLSSEKKNLTKRIMIQ